MAFLISIKKYVLSLIVAGLIGAGIHDAWSLIWTFAFSKLFGG